MQVSHAPCHVRAPCAIKVQRQGRTVAVRVHADARTKGLSDPAIALVNGAVTEGPDLSVTVNGLKLPNPFVIGSGPPGTNYQVMKKAFDEGWGAVICKTLSLDSSKVGQAVAAVHRSYQLPLTSTNCGWNHGMECYMAAWLQGYASSKM